VAAPPTPDTAPLSPDEAQPEAPTKSTSWNNRRFGVLEEDHAFGTVQ
jgi:hypothetical protein